MKLNELRQDTTVKKWLSNLKPKRNTELAYLQALSAYTEYNNLTPYELIAEADGEESASVRMREDKDKRPTDKLQESPY